MTRCYFEGWPEAGACDGRLIRGHLIPRQLLRRELPFGVVMEHGEWRRLGRYETHYGLEYRSLAQLINDERSWMPCCGGAVGLSGHHGRLDSLTLRVPRERLPVGFVTFCEELGLGWFVERTYGNEREAA